MTYLAFVLDERSRAKLLQELPPSFAKVIAHHVTIIFPKTSEEQAEMRRLYRQLLDQEHDVQVNSYYKGEHIEAAGVTFNGDTKRPTGGFYHVTLSLEAPAKPVDSNKLTSPQRIKPFELTGKVKLVD